MRTLKIKAVILTNGTNYFIHGNDDQDAKAMFKAMTPIWDFDPSVETAHYIEIEVSLPELEDKVNEVTPDAG